MKPLHAWSSYAGQTVHWISPDSKENYQQHMNDPAKRSMLQQFGWVGQSIDYTFNSDGFRTQEFDSRENFVALGCSFTQGTGVAEHERWTSVLSQHLGIWCWNLGIAGAAGDTCYRMARYYLTQLRPRFVVFLEPRNNRIELHAAPDQPPHLINWTYDQHNWGSGTFVKTLLAHDENLEIRAEKNRAAIAHVCDQLGIPVVMYAPNDYRDLVADKTQLDLGRDLLHPGRLNNQAFAQVVYQHTKDL
jgi:hypothetical protein